MKAFHTAITRRLSVAPRRAVDPTNTESSLAAFGSGALLARASLMSALRLPGFVPCAKFALAFGANGARSANPAYNLAGRGVLAVAQRLVEGTFVAGESLDDALRLAERLEAERGVGVLIDHSVEDAVDLGANRARKARLVDAVPAGAMVPLKATALADVAMLEELSDLVARADDPDAARLDGALADRLDSSHAYAEAVDCLAALGEAAGRRGVALLLDAERTPIQPAVDHVVRGAYLADERPTGKVRESKAATDAAYDAALASMLGAAAAGRPAFLVAATHNPDSAAKAVDALDELGLRRDDERVAFAQILGIDVESPFCCPGCRARKLVLYGAFDDVAPWIARRLDENKDALGAPIAENALLWRELRRRAFGRTAAASPADLAP
ncbi:proline dehydrogenase [Aureococcus anophagefferens]|nr:proline dehydrogenase [Aureococcus anophagefferens]